MREGRSDSANVAEGRENVPRDPINKINNAFHFYENIIELMIHKTQAAGLPAGTRWVDALDEEDLSFIKRFVLASGSLKELAGAYSISYPTVRLRLDRLIQKIELLDRHDVTSPFERLLRMQLADGKIDRQTLKLLLDAHQAEIARERNE